ncbi:MAG: hypothetical protein FJ255_10095 [Phycisphaerae bacterium]|nr:hypothetical protein [Phycisphaerae bacterium]
MPPPAEPELDLRCPWCLYELSGIARHGTCPECGKDTGPASRATAAAGRVLREGKFRAVFFASPGIGLFAGIIAWRFVGGSPLVILATLAACMAATGVFAVWRTQPIPEARRLGPALLLGPIMALVYLAWVAAVANTGITAILAAIWLRCDIEFPSIYAWLLPPAVAIVLGGGLLIRRVLKT